MAEQKKKEEGEEEVVGEQKKEKRSGENLSVEIILLIIPRFLTMPAVL